MTEIPESVMEEALKVARCVILDEDQTPLYLGFVSRNVAKAILAAEKRGEERERERCAANLFDRDAFMTACSGDGDPHVKVQFKTLKEMHSFHSALCDLAAAIRKEPAE